MAEQQKLHPLHDPQWVAGIVADTGQYPGKRGTGRTTAMALESIAQAIRNPEKVVEVRDHSGHLPKYAATLVISMVRRLGLRHMHISNQDSSYVYLRFHRGELQNYMEILSE